MKPNPEKLANRIRNIRKANHRSIHDCASLLDISKEHYLRFENDSAPLSLPELELLARFFAVPLEAFLDDSPLENYTLSLPKASQRAQYIQLRHKMIQAQIDLLRKNKGMTLAELHQETGISQEAMAAFDQGMSPIPISNLMVIADCLGESLDHFFNEDPQSLASHDEDNPQKKLKWQPEYPENKGDKDDQDTEPLNRLMNALQQVPKDDQARIAKALLQLIKSLQ